MEITDLDARTTISDRQIAVIGDQEGVIGKQNT
jgi:hypothetical protein